MKTHQTWAAILITAALAGCGGSPDTMPGTDAGTVTPGTDGGTVTPGTDGGVTPGTDGGSVTPGAFRAITLPGPDEERVTGMLCPSAGSCVVSTAAFIGESHLYVTDGTTITGTLLTGDDALGEMVGVLGAPEFLGFSQVGGTTIARVDEGGSGFITATGDLTQASSWSVQRIGTLDGEGFGLNAQYGFGSNGSEWLQFRNSLVYSATSTPGPTTAWTLIWSPQAIPPTPGNIAELHDADPTVCTSDPGFSAATRPTQAAYVASDSSLVITAANGFDVDSDDPTGVCISTDGGHMFHLAAFADVAELDGPSALHCTSASHCVVAGGQWYADLPETAYVYVSSNAASGAASTWTRATIPASYDRDHTSLSYIFFAPDAQHGWIAGDSNGEALLWATSDGGTTWTDVTSQVSSFAPSPLWSGIALDASRIMVGGEDSTLVTNF